MYKLRELDKDDITKINKWRNDKDLISNLGAPFRYINVDVDYKWYEIYMQNRSTNIRCAIVEVGNEDDILGMASLINLNYINQSADFHIMIGEHENRGKGMGFFSTKEMLNHAFYDLNLNRIELGVLQDNYPALNLYEKVGFKQEGIKRKSIYKNGKFIDMIIMSILKEDYYK
jgi:RimJ/RimL family protein N-acetyltransferase